MGMSRSHARAQLLDLPRKESGEWLPSAEATVGTVTAGLLLPGDTHVPAAPSLRSEG